ncbi:MAG TPA: hypothetical protein VFA05_02250 [Gaiellaceae bacterium]|nr:hypothetical protein [Gaiellaceae bacterium]
MPPPRRRPSSAARSALVAALAVLALLAAFARPAAASTPCWKALLNDWYDGRIDHTYPLHCYSDALRHLPSDVKTYSSAADDIERALQSARARLRREHRTTKIGPNTLIPPQGGGRSGGGKSGGGGGSGAPGGSGGAGGGAAGGGGSTTKPITGPGLASQVRSSSPSSIPVPLLVLGGLALLLVAAGAAGLVAKRVQGRKRAL